MKRLGLLQNFRNEKSQTLKSSPELRRCQATGLALSSIVPLYIHDGLMLSIVILQQQQCSLVTPARNACIA